MTKEEIEALEREIHDARIEWAQMNDELRFQHRRGRDWMREHKRKMYDLRVWLNESVKRLQREEKRQAVHK